MSKICVGMSDEERKAILDKKILELSQVKDNIKIKNVDEKSLNFAKEIITSKLNANKIAQRLYEEFFQGENAKKFPLFKNEDIELEFEYSKGGIKESIQKQMAENYDDFAKMLTCFDDVVKNGIGIEVHENRYEFDNNTDKIFVLVSAFQDKKNIHPVKMEIKTFKDNNSEILKENPKLYVLITSEHMDIKKEEPLIYQQGLKDPNCPKRSSFIKIRDFLKNVNKESESLIKYIPDGYLDEKRLLVKKEALEKEKEYILQKQKNRAIKIEERQQRREEIRSMSLAERKLMAMRERKGESLEAIKQPPETKQLSLAEKMLNQLRSGKSETKEQEKGLEK